MDYTNTQTESIKPVCRMPSSEVSEGMSELAEKEFKNQYGPRGIDVHVKASKGTTWHFGPKWDRFMFNYPKNRTVFVQLIEWLDGGQDLQFKGWLYHNEITSKWFDCGAGHCLNTDLHPMKEFR